MKLGSPRVALPVARVGCRQRGPIRERGRDTQKCSTLGNGHLPVTATREINPIPHSIPEMRSQTQETHKTNRHELKAEATEKERKQGTWASCLVLALGPELCPQLPHGGTRQALPGPADRGWDERNLGPV